MTTLTNEIRRKMANTAVEKAGIVKAEEEHEKNMRDWAEAVRIDALGGPAGAKKVEAIKKKVADLIAQLPTKLQTGGVPIRVYYDIQLNVAGRRVTAMWGGSQRESYRVAPRDHTLKADHPLAIRFDQLENERLDLEARRAEVYGQVLATLNNFTTVKKLLAAWPEAAELLPETMPEKQVVNLPAVRVEELNTMVGLPSKPEPKKRRRSAA